MDLACSPIMGALQAILLTPSKSSVPIQLLSRRQSALLHPEPRRVTPLAATLTQPPLSVANKRLTVWLSPLDATLTKNRGVGGAAPLTRIAFHRGGSLSSQNGPPLQRLPSLLPPSTLDCQLSTSPSSRTKSAASSPGPPMKSSPEHSTATSPSASGKPAAARKPT